MPFKVGCLFRFPGGTETNKSGGVHLFIDISETLGLLLVQEVEETPELIPTYCDAIIPER